MIKNFRNAYAADYTDGVEISLTITVDLYACYTNV
jgi:hypothetical protein